MAHLDLYLSHPAQPGVLFNVQTKLADKQLVFEIIHLTWNEDKQENDEQHMIPLGASAFGGWYQARMADGWQVQP